MSPKAPKGSKKASKPGSHLYVSAHTETAPDSEEATVPRGWISPDGKFIRTNFHWNTISVYLGERGTQDEESGERNAHTAYSLGWISLGHGGVLNAIGHRSTFESTLHPALVTLRKLASKLPHLSFRIERQFGKLDPETGRHDDFDLIEYDLEIFIRRGRLRKYE